MAQLEGEEKEQKQRQLTYLGQWIVNPEKSKNNNNLVKIGSITQQRQIEMKAATLRDENHVFCNF